MERENQRHRDDAIERAREILADADRVIIGAGAGLSTAAGLAYGGARFAQYFGPFIERYGMTDMYSAGFYPFPTPEDEWAYWSQHVWVNRFEPGATHLYRDLAAWTEGHDYFVITTNVDAQFELAGFDRGRDGRTVLLELGVGWNTPVWIRYPFERMAHAFGCPLVRMNYDNATADSTYVPNGVGVQGDIAVTWPLVSGGSRR